MSPRRARTQRSLLLVPAVALALSCLVPTAQAEERDPSTASSATAADTGDTVVGELVQAWPENTSTEGAEHTEAGPLSFVETPDGASVRVVTDDLVDVPAGATVAVTLGAPVADEPAVDLGLAPAHEVQEAAVLRSPALSLPTTAASTGVTNSVTVVRLVPAGGRPDGMAAETIAGVVDGPVAGFWRAQTGGRVQLGVTRTVPDWVWTNTGCDDPTGLWRAAASAAQWSGGPGQHLLVYVSSAPADLSGCSLGLAEVGTSLASGGRAYVRSASVSVIAHELGHAFGLGHSSELQCDGAIDSGACEVAPYRDLYDVMGGSWGQLGSLNAPQAARLGVLPTDDVVSFTPSSASTSVSLGPLGASGAARAIRLSASDGTTYWIECRGAVGQDSWLGTGDNSFRLQPGVTIRRAADGDDTSLLLDASPSSRQRWAADLAVAVPAGSTTSLAGGEFTLTVRDGGARALVEVGTRSRGGSADVGGRGSAYLLNDALSGRASTTVVYGDPDDVVLVGDWDGNGTDTLAVRRGNTFFVKNDTRSGVADAVFVYGDPGDAVLVGDWDGNGTDTLAVRRGNTFFVKNDTRSGVADAVFAYGDPGDAVLVGDWDGNGTSTLAVRRGGRYFVKNDTRSGVADRVFDYGSPSDTVLVGRWSPTQMGESLMVRRGGWYLLRYSLTTGRAEFEFGYGDPSDTAFVGDWDGDGVDGIGVRR